MEINTVIAELHILNLLNFCIKFGTCVKIYVYAFVMLGYFITFIQSCIYIYLCKNEIVGDAQPLIYIYIQFVFVNKVRKQSLVVP